MRKHSEQRKKSRVNIYLMTSALRPFIHGKEAAKNDFESLVYTPDMEAMLATSIKSYS